MGAPFLSSMCTAEEAARSAGMMASSNVYKAEDEYRSSEAFRVLNPVNPSQPPAQMCSSLPRPSSRKASERRTRSGHKSRGACVLCAEPVLGNQRRLKVKDGYVHEECAHEQQSNRLNENGGQGSLGNPTQNLDKAHSDGGNKQETSTCNYSGCSNSASGQCRRCKLVYYCCREHQLDDWKAHKEICASKPVSSLASLSEVHLQAHNGICDRVSSRCSSEPSIVTDESARHVCNHHSCHNIAEGQCRRCKKVYYCCKSHQHDDWQAHKAVCFAAPEYAVEKLREYAIGALEEDDWLDNPFSRQDSVESSSSRRSSNTVSSCGSIGTLTHCSSIGTTHTADLFGNHDSRKGGAGSSSSSGRRGGSRRRKSGAPDDFTT